MKILYGICTWGLGHASRSLPVIRQLTEEGHEVHVVTSGRALSMMKRETEVKVHDLPDYPSPYTGSKMTFYAKFLTSLPGLFKGIKAEHEAVERMHRRIKFDRVISDNRYGVYLERKPSYLMTHQMRFLAPKNIKTFERKSEKFVADFSDKFERYLIPDEDERNLTGILSHDLDLVPRKKIEYVGILTDFRPVETEQDIDVFISVSGPEPQRTKFEKLAMAQTGKLKDKKIVVSRGVSDSKAKVRTVKGVEVHDYMSASRRAEYLSRSYIVLTRSGYSTLMDLAAMGRKAILVPTPGQTEQEYLARKHFGERHWAHQDQKKIDLRRGYDKAHALIPPKMDAEGSVKRVLEAAGI